MMKKYLSLLAVVVFIISNCSVKSPEVKITGEKTALENQVIGTYQEIEQDSWTIASVRSSSGAKTQPMSDEKKKVLTAVQNRRFNKDDINEFKRDGVIGENNKGFLEIRDDQKLDKDEEYRKRVEKIIADENRDRQIIKNRAIQVNEQIAQAGEESVDQVFAKIYQDESEAGTWLQLADGTWLKKKELKE